MKTLQSLAELILLPLGLDTDMLQVEAIKQRILSYRQTLIQQDYNRYLRVNESLVQAFNLKLTEVQEGEDKFYISEILPKPIILRKSDPFLSVSTTLSGRNKKQLGFITIEEVPYISYRKFTSKGNYYTYENNRIVVYADVSVRVRAIWDNPLEVARFAETERFKLACSKDTISSPCADESDVLLEETLAARILTFFNSNDSNNNKENSSGAGD